jgi:hypothetical protein
MERAACIAWFAAVVSSGAWAGGSDAPVTIESLEVNGANYTLVVVPTELAKDDPYIGRCARFTVLGTYRYLKGAFLSQPEILSKKQHLAALEYLQNAFEKRLGVNLGWMGSGFTPIDDNEPCVVLSRALLLVEDGRGRAVISFHNAI